MTISIGTFVGVDISVAPKAAAKKGFGTLVFVTPNATFLLAGERYRPYDSFEAVQVDAPSGEVYEAAKAYYSQNPAPLKFIVCGVFGTARAATLTSGAVESLANLKLVTAGGFTLTVNGVPIVISNIDLSGIVDEEDAVAILQTALGSSVVVSYVSNAYVITTTLIGAEATLAYPTSDVSGLASVLGLTQVKGATIIDGNSQETPVEALGKFVLASYDGYGIVTDRVYRDTEDSIDVAEWVEASKKVYFNTTNDPTTLLLAGLGTGSSASRLKAKSLMRTLTSYSSHPEEYPSASVAGRAFTVNFEGTNTTITLMYKKLPGITVEDLGPSEYAALVEKNANAFLDVGGNSMYATSVMANGNWFDTVHGTDWMQNHMETGVFNLVYQTPKIPYTDVGVGMVVQRMEMTFRQAIRNGLIAPGTTADGEYLPQGFKIMTVPVAEVDAADKGARLYRGITFKCTGSGAIQFVKITGTFDE